MAADGFGRHFPPPQLFTESPQPGFNTWDEKQSCLMFQANND
jgi:hypothetical protein